jgi:FHA domain
MKLYVTLSDAGRDRDLVFDIAEGATLGDLARAASVPDDDNVARPTLSPNLTLAVDGARPQPASTNVMVAGIRSGQRVKLIEGPASPATPVSGVPTLSVTYTNRSSTHIVGLEHGVNTVGRGSTATARIDDPSLSRPHFRITVGDTCEITNLTTSSVTRVNGQECGEVPVFSNRCASASRYPNRWSSAVLQSAATHRASLRWQKFQGPKAAG